MPYKNKIDYNNQKKRYRNSEKDKAYRDNWKKEHKKEISEYNKKWKEKNKDKRKRYIIENKVRIQNYCKTEKYKKRKKNYYLMRDFNITIEDYNKLFEKQNGRCSICDKHQSELNVALSVDHDHITGRIRSLLCGNCNLLLGNANDNIDILKNAIEYLIKYHE